MTSANLAALAAALEGKPPAEILAAAVARHPGRIALACGFGPEDCLLVDIVGRAGLLVDVFALDAGSLLPETAALWRELEDRYRLRIDPAPRGALRPDPPRGSVDSLEARLATLGAWITGARRDQSPERAGTQVIEWNARHGLEQVNPLAAWTSDQVWTALRQGGVPTGPREPPGRPGP